MKKGILLVTPENLRRLLQLPEGSIVRFREVRDFGRYIALDVETPEKRTPVYLWHDDNPLKLDHFEE